MDWSGLGAAVTEVRVNHPGLVQQLYQTRSRRARLTEDGHLVIVAADHPARRVLAASGAPWAMANRLDYLRRILRVLAQPGVDGVMATADILDELLLMGELLAQRGLANPVADKLLIGCLNRGGLAGAAWELEDQVTGHRPEALAEQGLDGGKLLLRLNLAEPAAGRTLLAVSEAVDRIARLGLPVFVEPLPVQLNASGGWEVVKTAEALTPLVGVASALGSTSARTWLKLPIVPDLEQVARATTLPIVLLGGESHGQPEAVLTALSRACAVAPNVRGLMIGRNVLYPGADVDPGQMARAVAHVARARGGAQEVVQEAVARLREPLDQGGEAW